MKIKRKSVIKTKDFLNTFKSRRLSPIQKLNTKFVFIEDVDGNYYLAESMSLYFKLIVVLLLPFFLVGMFLYAGTMSCVEVVKDFITELKRPYGRIDDCYHGQESTEKLKELAKWG